VICGSRSSAFLFVPLGTSTPASKSIGSDIFYVKLAPTITDMLKAASLGFEASGTKAEGSG
jgi:hypothetical protein